MLTLTGAGGIGKTRLAIQSARDLLSSFRDGVFFVPLAPLGAGQIDFIVPAIANALGFSFVGTQDPNLELFAYLRERQMLLLLDNFEHLLDAASLVIEILQNAPNVKLLITSREPLNAQAEWVTRVEGLSYPTSVLETEKDLFHYSAVHMFVERAQRVDEHFRLNSETAPHVIRLAQILEGMPLALELAAARMETTTVGEICFQVQRNLDFLATTMRDVEPRHRSLRAVLDWSYASLLEAERQLFQCLWVFANGWTLEAAQDVAEDGLVKQEHVRELLGQLNSKSLVMQEELQNSIRFRLLEPVRQYALEKTQDRQEIRRLSQRHLYFFLKLAETAEAKLEGTEQSLWLDNLEKEHDNFRAALHYSLGEPEAEVSLRLSSALRKFWFFHSHWYEARRWLRQGLAVGSDVSDRTRAKALNCAGFFALVQNDYAEGVTLSEGALALFRQLGDGRNAADSLHNLGMAATDQGDFIRGVRFVEEGLALRRELGDKRGMAYSHSMLGQLALAQGNYVDAGKNLNESLELFRELDEKWGIALQLCELGIVELHQANYARATELLQESLVLFRMLGDQRQTGRTLLYGARTLRNGGSPLIARAQLVEALSLLQGMGDKEGITQVLEELAFLDHLVGKQARAVRLLGGADLLREQIGIPLAPAELKEYDLIVTAIHAHIGKTEFDRVWEEGRAMTMEQTIAYALHND